MKKIFLFLFICAYPIISYATMDERKVDVYFANGIKTNEGTASANTQLLLRSIIDTQYNGSEDKMYRHIGKVIESYNNTNGMSFDLIESADQKLDLIKWRDWLASLVGYVTSHASDLKKQIDAYKASISSGHSILVVAHSQGNLFTGEAFAALDPCMQERFEAVSIASPMSADIKDGTPRINWDNDIVPQIAGSSGGITNSVRKIAWKDTSYDPLNHEEGVEARSLSAVNGYTTRSNISKMYDDVLKATEGGINSAVHAFAFYMGSKLHSEDLGADYVDPFTKGSLTDNSARGAILSAIAAQLEKLRTPIPMPTSKHVDIDIKLMWGSGDISLDLSSELGEHEKSYSCNRERFYLESADDVEKGTYAININHKGDVDDMIFPQSVEMTIKTPTDAMHLAIVIKTADMLDIGHVADIIVDENMLVTEANLTGLQLVIEKFKYIHGGESSDFIGSGGMVGARESNGCYVPDQLSYAEAYDICYPKNNEDNGGGIYEEILDDEKGADEDVRSLVFDVRSQLTTAEMGPISGATVYLTEVKSDELMYETSTTGGSSMTSSGILQLPRTMLNDLLDNNYYLVTIVGGVDIDSDDNGIVEENVVEKRGDLHALIKGDILKNEHFKVNLLTEVVYQVNKELVYNTDDIAVVDAAMNETAKRLLMTDSSTYMDALKWMARFDKRKLRKNYNLHYEPIAQKIYRGDDIYLDAYDIVNKPSLLKYLLKINENNTSKEALVSIDIGIDTTDAVYTLIGKGSELFSINEAGDVHLKDNISLDYEKQNEYNLTLRVATGIYTEFSSFTLLVKNVLDVPEADDLDLNISDSLKSGALVGQLALSSPVDAPVLSLSLDDNNTFDIDSNGSIYLKESMELDYFQKKRYLLKAWARNRYGSSLPINININLSTAPTVQSKVLSLLDFQEGGPQVVGDLEIIANGKNIENVILVGTGSEDFNISLDGKINITTGHKLDARRQELYDLDVFVNGSKLAEVQIVVNDRIINTVTALDDVTSLSVDKNRSLVYVADNNYDGAAIIDLSEPGNLYFKGRTSGAFGSVNTVASDASKTFVEGSYGKVEFFDVSTEQGLVSSSVYAVSYTPRFLKMLPKNGLVAVGLYDHIDLLKREDNGSVRSVKKLYYRRSHDIMVTADEKYMFVPRYDNSILILDITDVQSPKQVGTLSNLTHVCIDIIDQRFIAIAGGNEAGEHVVEIYDMSDLTSVALVSTMMLETGTEIKTLVHDSTHLYAGSDVLNVIDMTDVTAPRLIETIDIPGGVEDAVVLEDREQMIIASGTSGVHLVSLEGFAPYVGVPGALVLDRTVERDAAIGSIVGQVDLVYSGSGVVTYAIVGEASDFFTIDTAGIVHVSSSLAGSPIECAFQIAVTNSAGTRLTDARIYVHSVPIIADFNGSINSMSPSGTVVGFIDLGSDDAASIETISLSGEGSDYFSVEASGKIIFTGGVELHHFITPNYDLDIQASNRFGVSDVTQIMINVTPVVSSIQLFEDTSKYISQIKPSVDGSYVEVEIYKYYEDMPQYVSRINIHDILNLSLENQKIITESSQMQTFNSNKVESIFDDNKTVKFERGEMGEGLVIKDASGNTLTHYDSSDDFDISNMSLIGENVLIYSGTGGLGTLNISNDKLLISDKEHIIKGEVQTFTFLDGTTYLLIGVDKEVQILDLYGMGVYK